MMNVSLNLFFWGLPICGSFFNVKLFNVHFIRSDSSKYSSFINVHFLFPVFSTISGSDLCCSHPLPPSLHIQHWVPVPWPVPAVAHGQNDTPPPPHPQLPQTSLRTGSGPYFNLINTGDKSGLS